MNSGPGSSLGREVARAEQAIVGGGRSR